MNKTIKYSKLLTQYCLDFEKTYKNDESGLSTIAIIDKDRHHYQTAIHGFSKEQPGHVFMVQFHFDIIGNKIWIQRNNTDTIIEDELLELGVPKSDIVFGSVPEYGRYLQGFGLENKETVTA